MFLNKPCSSLLSSWKVFEATELAYDSRQPKDENTISVFLTVESDWCQNFPYLKHCKSGVYLVFFKKHKKYLNETTRKRTILIYTIQYGASGQRWEHEKTTYCHCETYFPSKGDRYQAWTPRSDISWWWFVYEWIAMMMVSKRGWSVASNSA